MLAGIGVFRSELSRSVELYVTPSEAVTLYLVADVLGLSHRVTPAAYLFWPL
jgi:hypothetical protein